MHRGFAAAFCLIAVCALAQSSATSPRHFDATEYGSRIALGPEWLFAPGDDPSYASPLIDDSHWRVVSAQNQLSDYGYRDLQHAWYRTHVHLRPDVRDLAIETTHVHGSYEIYANGALIGGDGNLRGIDYRYQLRTIAFPVRSELIPASGDLVLALRFVVNPKGEKEFYTPLGPGSGVYLVSRDAAIRDQSYAKVLS